jgi:hypothetical protein
VDMEIHKSASNYVAHASTAHLDSPDWLDRFSTREIKASVSLISPCLW